MKSPFEVMGLIFKATICVAVLVGFAGTAFRLLCWWFDTVDIWLVRKTAQTGERTKPEPEAWKQE